MVVYNAGTRELTAKIVYYGPGLGGKTTNLQVLHDRLDPSTVGKLLNLATQTDRTIYFDLLPVELGDIKGYKIRFQLATVPGQTAFNETRRVVLRGADGIVFVADSQWTMLPKNLESWHNLKENLKANGVSFEGIPIVVQFNKRDLTDILSVDALQEALGLSSYPFVEAVASAGRGVTETFKLISKLTFVDLLRRLQGRKPEDAAASLPPRKEKESDDLLSWKDSLLTRATPAGGVPKRTVPLSLVTAPPEEAPFEAAEEPAAPSPAPTESLAPTAAADISEGPFGQIAEIPIELPPIAPPSATQEMPKIEASEPAPPPEIAPPPIEIPDRPTERIEYADPVMAAKLAAPLFPPKPAVETPRTPPPEPAFRPISPEIEARLAKAEAAASAISARIEAFEREARALTAALAEQHDSVAGRLDAVERTSATRQREQEPRIRALEERLDGGEKRQRTAEDDVSMALRALSERGEKFHQRLEAFAGQIEEVERQRTAEDFSMTLRALSERGEQFHQRLEAFAGQIEEIERAIQEKTSQTRREADDIRAQIDSLSAAFDEKVVQGRRESEDIRTQIAPLLEAHGQKPDTHEQLLSEFDRLRSSLAESLSDLSERLRNAVRGM